MQSQVRFNRVAEEVPEKVGEALVQSQLRFQQGSGEASGEGQVRFNTVPEKVPAKVWEALVQSQVRFNMVPEKEVPGQVQQGSGEGSGEGSGRLVQMQVRFNRVPEKVWEALEQAEVLPALGFAAHFRNICKNKTLRLSGIPPKLI